MKVCIIGDGLVSLTLANILIKKGLVVDIIKSKKKNKYDKTRTIGITRANIDYFNNEIINIEKIIWKINKIKIFTEKNSADEILEFDDKNQQIFSIVRNYDLQKLLINKLKKNNLIKFKTHNNYKDILKQKYKLIINNNPNHQISNFFFFNKIEKNYYSHAFTTVINHKKLFENKTAFQNFTRDGPIAFLPVSETQTSVVCSLRDRHKQKKFDIKNLIKKYNPIYSITKINECSSFELKSSNLRKYYKDNILAFGDLLHKIHPLAGQGFNMSLRDIKLLSNLIDEKISLGLDIDNTICEEFQKNSRDKNYLFSTSIDLIYELFNFESKIKSDFLSKTINLIGKNIKINSLFKSFANKGLEFKNY